MILLILSAAFVGWIHSLTPAHWIPVVLLAKANRWNLRKALAGALTAAAGHVIISLLVGFFAAEIGAHLLTQHEEEIERNSGLLLLGFGLLYSSWMLFQHYQCRGAHEHHGPAPDRSDKKTPFTFLFLMGFSPCIAVLPVLTALGPYGWGAVLAGSLSFSLGVVFALTGATWVASRGLLKLDLPWLEHYGDLFAGLGIAAVGLVLYLL